LLKTKFAVLLACSYMLAQCDSTTQPPPPPEIYTITVQPAQDTLRTLGRSIQLQARVFDRAGAQVNKTLIWRSSNLEVARVDESGRVTAIANGGVDISVTTGGDDVGLARIIVRQAPATLTLSMPVDTIRTLGTTVRLSVTAADSGGAAVTTGTVAWRSSDTTVLSVDAGGVVTAKRNGVATITAELGGLTRQLVVNVFDPRGAVRVIVRTTGAGVDADGYTVAVGSTNAGIGGNDTTVIAGVMPGSFPVSLTGLASHCAAALDRTTVTVAPTATVAVRFDVRCTGRYAFLRWEASRRSQLHYMDEFGVAHELAPDSVESFAWSPDGTRIAFSRTVDGNMDIYVIRHDGTQLTRLTNHPDADDEPSWSPDGNRIAFRSQAREQFRIYTIGADGSALTALTPQQNYTLYLRHGAPRWSPDGSEIAFVGFDCCNSITLHVMRVDGSGVRSIGSEGVNMSPAWSPDGNRLAYVGAASGMWELIVVNRDGSNRRVLASSSQSGVEPGWSPDGSQLVFTKYDGTRYRSAVIGSDGANERYLTAVAAFEPAWTPDGLDVLFTGVPTNVSGIEVVAADGSNLQVLTQSTTIADQRPVPRPRW
jgi:TolB protein